MKYMRIASKTSGAQAIDANANITSHSKNLYIGFAIYIINNVDNIIKICVLILNLVVNKNMNRIIVGIIAKKQLTGNRKNIISKFKVCNFWMISGMFVISVANKPNKAYKKYVKPSIAKKFALKRFGSLLKCSFSVISRL